MNIDQRLLQELATHLPGSIKREQQLADLSYWKIGGKAAVVVEPATLEELSIALTICSSFPETPKLIVGDMSNLLFDDRGFAGVLIRLGNNLSRVEVDGQYVTCEAGVWVPQLAHIVSRYGLSGIEHICGIPGRLGGLIFMNGGSNRRGILENVESVTTMTTSGDVVEFSRDMISHEYRTSPFQNSGLIIAAAKLKLDAKVPQEIRHEMRNILASRRKKFPRKLPNCGSVFLSNPKMYDVIGPPGFAIEKAGLKGVRKGQAQISPLHANFIVNLGGASSKDVLYLIGLARDKVFENTGFKMNCEVRYVDYNGTVEPAHKKSDQAT